MEVFLYLNGCEIDATVDEQEAIVLSLAAGELDRSHFLEWVRTHAVPRNERPSVAPPT
jgi:death-on-curing protein